MKLKYLFVGLCMLTLVASGCSNQGAGEVENNTLSIPTNILYDGATFSLEWSIVEHASSYIVNIDGRERDSGGYNYFDVSTLNLTAGEHSAKVKAVGNNKYVSSPYSDDVSFNIINYDEIYENYSSSKKLHAYSATKVDNLEISNSANVAGKYYLWYFDLGVVRDVPVYTSYALRYDYDVETKFNFGYCTTQTISEASEHVDELVKSHSSSYGLAVGVTEETTYELGVNVGINIDSVVDIGISNKYAWSLTNSKTENVQWTNSWDRKTSDSYSVEKSYTESYEEGYEISIAFREEYGFTLNRSYRISFYELQTVYGLLIYDIEEDIYQFTYENFYQPNQKTIVIEESDANGIFDYGVSDILDFDVDAAIELAKNNIPEEIEIKEKKNYYVDSDGMTYEDVYLLTPSNKLVFDLTKYQKTGFLDEFTFPYYLDATGVLTINPMLDGWEIYSVEIIGSYGCINSTDGSRYGNYLLGLSIEFSSYWERDINLTLTNIAFSGSTRSNKAAIQASNNLNLFINRTTDSNGPSVNTRFGIISGSSCIYSSNDVSIVGLNDASIDLYGMYENPVIKCNDLSITDINLGITAGNGERGADGASYYNEQYGGTYAIPGGNGTNGGNGGAGIQCNALSLENNVSLVVIGGNGGQGGQGGHGQPIHGSSTATGGAGGKGGNGGNGMSAIIASKIKVFGENNNIYAKSGNGGNGGNGGEGGYGHQDNVPDNGGRGGDGGHGGNSLFPIICDEYEILNECPIICAFGNGGNGGNGGKGGNATETGTHSIFEGWGTSGSGGNGGNGGNCYIFFSAEHLTIDESLNYHAGYGGNGGSYGPSHNSSHNGQYGSKGSDGSIIS